ncbi:T9SS type A sorting domain-containing protein, partial [Aquimarina celericrescens]|nr:T9SS type A sorting domain-containing protein [Aquimarina celericrescens]
NTLFDVKVFDINGRLIKSKTLKEGQLYMGDLIQGVYILSLSNRETNFYKSIKIIKK